jgi:hypothetical protein
MTQRLPIPGQDNGTWGDILNAFLEVSHNSDGTLVPSALTTAGAITTVNSKSPTSGAVTLAASDVGALTQSQADARYPQSGVYVPPAGKTTTGAAAPAAFYNILDYGAVGNGTTSDGAAVTAFLATSPVAGSELHFPPSPSGNAYVLDTGPYTLPAGVSVTFSRGAKVQVPASAQVGVWILNSGCSVQDMTCDGASSSKTTTTKCIALISGASDCRVVNPTITNWCGYGIYGIANTRPSVTGGVITATIGGVRFTTGSSGGWSGVGDVVAPTIRGLEVTGCSAGTGIQYDGDWNNSTWRTAGYKVRYGTIEGCTSNSNYYAGIFINSGFQCVIANCHTNGNSDYGQGIEYSDHTIITSGTSSSNATLGFTIENNGQYNVIQGCTAVSNTSHGIWVNYNNGVVSGDTAGFENSIVGCTSNANGAHGIEVNGGMFNISLLGNICRGNTLRGIDLAYSNESVINGGRCSYNTEDGIGISELTDVVISGVDTSHNSAAGINVQSSTTDFTITGCNIHHGSNTGIKFTATSVTEGLIVGNRIHDNTGYGIDSTPYLPTYIRVTGNRLRNNSAGGIRFIEGYDCEISENRIHGNGSGTGVGVSMLDSSGSSGGRYSIRNNKFRTLGTGVAFSVGANVSAGDDVYVQDNEISPNVTTPYSYGAVGTVANLFFRAVLTAAPNNSIYAAPGSQVTVSAGGSATTLWVKESGTNTNTGWVGK